LKVRETDDAAETISKSPVGEGRVRVPGNALARVPPHSRAKVRAGRPYESKALVIA
jgi:hypothetical protein